MEHIAATGAPILGRFVLNWKVAAREEMVVGVLAISILEDLCAPFMDLEMIVEETTYGVQPSKESERLYELLQVVVQRVLLKAADEREHDSEFIEKAIEHLLGCAEVKEVVLSRIVWEGEDEPIKTIEKGPVDAASMVALPAEGWITVGRCGHWKDSRIHSAFTKRFGENWRTGYEWGSSIIDYRSGIQLYEEAYYTVLQKDPELLSWIIHTASECYDTSPSNQASYCSYSVQEVEGSAQHWQDVAVRRCLIRMGKWFQGDHPVEIRGRESEGFRLNPSELPFHLSRLIVRPLQFGWWKGGSIEDFSMSNFVVQTREEPLRRFLEAENNLVKGRVTHSGESLETILYCACPVVVDLLAAFALKGNPRTWAFIATGIYFFQASRAQIKKHEQEDLWDTLIGLVSGKGCANDAELRNKVSEGLATAWNVVQHVQQQAELWDRLLYYDIAIRKKAFEHFVGLVKGQHGGQDHPSSRTWSAEVVSFVIDVFLADPVKKLRAQAALHSNKTKGAAKKDSVEL